MRSRSTSASLALIVAVSSSLITLTNSITYRPACMPDQFQCTDQSGCVDRQHYCDGQPDCADYSDEAYCSEVTACREDQFKCEDDETCISKDLRCNGEVDCPVGGSDERNCTITSPPPSCRADEFRCRSGRCIPSYLRCNRYNECDDGSDEENCDSCGREEFRCNDGRCLSLSSVCNGLSDCREGEDERNCPNSCQPYEFQCRDSKKCIYLNKKCDGYPDCSDASDEENCELPCREDEITCGDGSCRRGELRCDGTSDCPDGADERDCRCRSDEFRCRDGSCVSYLARCDRRNDCRDGSDEENCAAPPVTQPPVTCAYGQFACHSGTQCVPQSAHCDNKHDCNDYSDEINCAANPTEGLNLKTYPTDQIIKESREVVFQCRDESAIRAMVNWVRADGLPLPPGSRNTRGRLEMPNIQLEHTGTYICEAAGFNPSIPGSRVNVYLKVEPLEIPTVPPREVCGFTEATCSNGECINKAQVCDGRYDCTDGSDELRCNPHGCEPNEFRCDNKKCVQKTWRCDSDDDCGDGSDERNCAPSPPGSMCRYDEFKCSKVDQCIPKAFHCDIEIDCQDGSDEIGCSKAEIQQAPPYMVKKLVGESMTITCTVVGVPTPEVVWRLNWGHVPSKCTSTSVNGHGTLNCPNLQVSDQGAYSCEALNNRGSVFAVPDTILMVQSNGSICPPGSFNALASRPEDCIQCFCFGVSTTCQSADIFIYQLPPPLQNLRAVSVYLPPGGKIDVRRGDSQFYNAVQQVDQTGFKIQVGSNDLSSSYYNPVYPYFALPEHYHNNQLKSYGGYLKYTVRTDGTGSTLPTPDVILSGNGYTLVYRVPQINPNTENNIAVRFFSPGDWYNVRSDSGREYPASRQEMMMALESVDQILIKAKYFTDGLETTITDINMDSAGNRDLGQGQAAYVEQCQCPAGYTGNSCEMCESTHRHQPKGPWLGICEPPVQCPPKYYKDPRDDRCYPCPCPHTDSYQFGVSCELGPDSNVTCSCPPGYQGRRCEMCAEPLYVGNPLQGRPCVKRPDEPECDAAGSKSTYRNPSTGRCDCKDLVTGPTCNQCKPNSFHLASDNVLGCISCFCMGVNTTCTSSDLYRDQISSAFTRDNQDFRISEINRVDESVGEVQLNPSSREIYFQQFNPGVVYYWGLPSKYLYNKVTSYGGFLRYTLRYVPADGGRSSPNSAPDVEIVSDNGVKLVHFTRQPVPPSNTPVTVSVPLREQYWSRIDGNPTSREDLLMALAELSHIVIKATYTTNAQEAALLSVSLDIGTDERNTGQNRAMEVERCYCPVGYRGTSCEECQAGYTRVEGVYLGTCEACDCHGHSTECDPETGHCMNCQGNTEGENCERCVRGYSGNPVAGEPCRPSGSGCSCDPRGTTHQGCDAAGNCICKTNVVGQSCSQCRRGTFNLAEANTEGCIECYCSGVPTQGDCHSSNLYREAIPMQIIDRNHQFALADISRRKVIRDNFNLNPGMNEIGYDLSNNAERLFWSLPPTFTGNKILSYGGNLNYTQHYTALPNYPPSHDTDVIIESPSMSIYWTDDGYIQPNVRKSTSIPLREQHWRRLDQTVGQRQASRAELLKVLSNVQAIMIRANPSTHTQETFLSDVSLDTAVSQRTASGVAVEVEVCQCPDGYRGTSCESCSSGFYQDFDGTCKKCPCNNNEEHCSLGPQQQVICTCRSPYGGPYCDRTVEPAGTLRPPGQPTISISIMEPTVIVIEAGRDYTFRCSGRSLVSSRPIELRWSKENGELPSGRAYDDRSGLLVIRDVQLTDAGYYICTASDGQAFVTERALLNVGGYQDTRPVITVTPSSLDVREGQPVEFRCEATGVPTPTLRWLADRSNRLPPQSSFASGVFRIPYASLQDEGTYTCTATNSAGEDSQTVSLYVQSAPATSPPPPEVQLTLYPQDYRGVAGETVKVECVASSSRSANIRLQWARQDGELSPNARDSNGMFTIYNSEPSDSGIYSCTAIERSTGAVAKQVQVRIFVSAIQRPVEISIEPPRQTAPQGTTAVLRCITSEGPVHWSKAGGNMPPHARVEGDTLRIERIQVSDRGVYMCQVDGPTGPTSVTSILEVERREAPAIELYPRSSQTVVEGGSVLYQCRLSKGIPSPTVTWSRVDGTPMSRQVEQLPYGVLRFTSVTRSDEGQYLCTAENVEGSASTVALLEVHSPPIITITPPGQTIQVSPGQMVRLDCRAYGHPKPEVWWTKDSRSYDPSYSEPTSVTSKMVEVAVYEIKGVRQEDTGSYTCLASSDAGTREQRIQLIINEDASSSGQNRGDIPSSSATIYPTDYYTVPLGGHVTFRCIAQGPQPIYLEWVRRNGQALGPHARQLNGELYIDQVQYADGGEYSCRGLSPSREELFTAVATLKVTATGPMTIKMEPERQVVRPGDNAMITCTATGEEPINISWESNSGRPLPPNILARGGVIQFNGIKESDAGRYVCKAQNRVGTLSATADVIVNDPHSSATVLRAADRHPVAIEGSSVVLRCDTPNYQQITWTREYGDLPIGRVSIDGPVLRINKLQQQDAGRYVCHTTERGISAQDYIDLQIEPAVEVELRIEPSTRNVHYGEPVELRCQATGPQAKVIWSLVGGPLPRSSQTYGNVLRINSATSEHNGVYRCTAILNNNRYDKDYSLAVLDDRPTHDAASAETVTAEYGQMVQLDCAIDLEGSVTHQWSKHGDSLPPNAPVSGPHLTIPSVTYKDAGLYICTASNGNITADIPKIILVRGAVPFFTQAPHSYLALPTLSNGYLNFTIDIAFKPEQNNGLILYNGQQDGGSGDFISFGLRDGIPEFRFDVGSGVGLMTGQRPLALGSWHTVQLSRNRKDGSMFVDGEEYYSNSSQGRMQGLDLAQPLYLGGVPDFSAIHKNSGFDRGFVGCISQLVIGTSEEIDIMKEQKELEGVTSCETCAVNPCTNQGVCQEAPTRAGYTCLCPRGFSGLNCSHQGEPCYPGICGSGRCLDTDNGQECYCGLGKAGERCDRDITVTEPSFNRNSYLAYPTPKMLSKLKVALKFNPSESSNGLLLYCAENDDGTGDFISLSIRDNYVEFKFDNGGGLVVMRSVNPVTPGQWQSVSATILGREASLSVTGDEAPVSRAIRQEVLKLTTPLYVGGYDQQRVRLANAVGVKHGFEGCINEVQVAGLNIDLLLSVVDSANVGQCQMGAGDPCLLRPCRNGGVCSPSGDRAGYRCECPDSFTGHNCEFEQDMCVILQDPCLNGGTCVGSGSSYTCHCPMGFAGSTCLERVEFRTEVQLNGDGHVELSRELMPHTDPDADELILLDFVTAQPNGLLLWHGQTPDISGVGQDYLALYVDNGYLTLSYELGSRPAKIRSEQQVNDGQRHRVEIGRQGREGTLIVDGRTTRGSSEGMLTQLNTKGNIYIGGLPNIEYMTGSQVGSITNFVGCINSLIIGDSGEINFAEKALNSVNVRPCSSSNGIEEDDDDYGPERGDQGR